MIIKKNINIEIGNRIKFHREKANLTQEEFSELLGMGTKTVSAFERGVIGVSLTTLKKICEALSISADEILFDHTYENDVEVIAEKLKRLSPKQFNIANDIIIKLLDAFSLNEMLKHLD